MRQLTFLFVFIGSLISAQEFPFEIKIDSIRIPQLGGIHSYSVGQANGKWLIIGGRLDGLHMRQPWASFDIAGHNIELIVVDPVSKEKWSASLNSLDQNLQEQLSSTNSEFFQKENELYLIGGYGFSAKVNDHITFPFLTVVSVSELISAVINKSDLTSYFKQIYDEKFAVTGGQLQVIDDVFFLIGGQRFDGRYNPMNNPTFTQTYTNSIQKFTLGFENDTLKVNHLSEIINDNYLHRRDFNALPQIFSEEKQGIIAFSGVFQKEVDLPYLNALVIDADSFKVQPSFAQYYNHYHCASISLFDKNYSSMHNLFFGGIAQYYDSSGFLVQDNDVPFVKTISRVTYNASGWMQEYKLHAEMPYYLGAASELIPDPSLLSYGNEVVKLNEIVKDTTLLGYIYGGINSSAANIFWINTGIESKASDMIYPVYLIKDPFAKTNPNDQSTNAVQLQIFPNPSDGEIEVAFTMHSEGDVEIVIKNLMGEIAYERILKKIPAGEYSRSLKFKDLDRGDVYYLHLTINGKTITQKMLVH